MVPDRPENARIRKAIGVDKARRVLIVLATHADADGYAWPSIPTIEAWTSLPRRAVADCLVYLVAAGVIEKAGKVGRAVRYRLIKERAAHDTSAMGRGLHDPSAELSGDVSCEVSCEVSGSARPEQEQEPNPPKPPAVRPDLLAALEREGITSADDIGAVVAIATADPETVDPVARLAGSPTYRRACVARWGADRDRRARARWEAAEKCPECGRPLGDCARANQRLAAADRCARLRGGSG